MNSDAENVQSEIEKQLRDRQHFYTLFKDQFVSARKLALKSGTVGSPIKSMGDDELADQLSKIVLPNLVCRHPKYFPNWLKYKQLELGDLPAAGSYREVVEFGAESLNAAVRGFGDFARVLCAITPAEFDVFLESLMAISNGQAKVGRIPAESSAHHPTYHSTREAAAAVGACSYAIKDILAAFSAATGASGKFPAIGGGRPRSEHTLIVYDIIELWEMLTNRPVPFPKADPTDYDISKKEATRSGRQRRRVRSTQGSTQFILEVMQMINPGTQLTSEDNAGGKTTRAGVEAAIRDVLEYRKLAPDKTAFHMLYYMDNEGRFAYEQQNDVLFVAPSRRARKKKRVTKHRRKDTGH